MEKQIDFLAIGDIVSEPFIKIKEMTEECDPKGGHCKLCFNFGEKIPYESAEVLHAVGNSPNAAVCASRLGLNTSIVSYIGDDQIGKEDLKVLMENNIHIDNISVAKDMDSNYHFVIWYQDERTILVKHTEFPYSFPADIATPKWIYLSSLAANSENYHAEIIAYLKIHPEVQLAFQPGTFQIKLGIEKLREVYLMANVFACNKEEAQKILGNDEDDILKLMSLLKELGPKIVVITDALNGSYAMSETETWFAPAYIKESFERTGAGDAFTSSFVSALIYEKSIPEALIWGAINSMAVVSKLGPQKGLLTLEELGGYLLTLPDENKPNKIK